MEATFVSDDGTEVRARLGQVLLVQEGQAECCYPDVTGKEMLVASVLQGMGRRVFGSRDGIQLGTHIQELPAVDSHVMLLVDSDESPIAWVPFVNYEAARLIQSSHGARSV